MVVLIIVGRIVCLFVWRPVCGVLGCELLTRSWGWGGVGMAWMMYGSVCPLRSTGNLRPFLFEKTRNATSGCDLLPERLLLTMVSGAPVVDPPPASPNHTHAHGHAEGRQSCTQAF
jgi:hypothetical protein